MSLGWNCSATAGSSVEPFSAVDRALLAAPPGDGLGDVIEVAGADLALVLGRGVAEIAGRLGGELGLLQLDVGAHLAARL
jgi:hypothetical protein